MRKYIILALLLTCLSAGAIFWAYTGINAQQEDITIKETVEAGKAEAAEGLYITAEVQDRPYELSWKVDMHLNGSGRIKSKTDFSYDPNRNIKLHRLTEDRYFAVEEFCYDTAYFDVAELQAQTYLAPGTHMPMKVLKAAFDAAKDRKREEDFTWNCYLDDYMDYFPVSMYTECLYYDHTMLETHNDADGERIDWTNYFKIPVPKDFSYQVEIKKKEFNTRFTMKIPNSDYEDETVSYQLNSDGFWYGEAFYLAISGMEEAGSGEIFAECPAEQRGIHVFPTVGTSYTFLDFKKGEMVYPIPSGSKVIDLEQSQDGKTLYLLTKNQDALIVDIIDKETFVCRQKLQLSKSLEYTASFGVCKTGDNWVFYSFNRGEFALIAEEDGIYEEVIGNTIGHLFEDAYINCDYNGNRLAVVTTQWDSDAIEAQLRVFGKNGCLYRGRFDYSFSPPYYHEWAETDSEYDKRVYVEFTDKET